MEIKQPPLDGIDDIFIFTANMTWSALKTSWKQIIGGQGSE